MSQVNLDVVKNEARRRIHNLVEDYMRVLADGKKESFNEERVKIAFIVPMLEALGWNPRTDEVLPEQATLTGRADFGLRVGRRTKIFVEMKRFSKRLDGHDTVKGRPRSYAEQAIQYAWGMKADWAVLTNFEEARLYDSHVKKPEDGLVWKKPVRFTEYESRFDELWLISRQSVASGALDAYKAKIERPPVDKAFLDDLMNCRQLLAEDIKNNNPGLTYDQINESVQKILDRLIFIKNCEDRLIIPAESLWKRYKAWQETAIDKEIVIFMMDLKNLFRYFDQVYNGKLFEKHPCEDLKISNEVLEEIIDTLYGDGQHLGYNFSVIPVDVLGQAYELYISSIIKEKEGQAKAVEIVKEPAKRKAHGIYYTPEPVVDYIVRGTLGEILEKCKTPEDVSRIKVLDPACGSGSFLIKAFDVLREWYENYNKLNRPTRVPGTLDAHIVPIPNPEERILTENLYGVDLDPQAVEITILNLSLKAVKTKEKLPYMADHIKCGNSLIDDEEAAGNKAFKWEEEFKQIIDDGGFDVVIGNPPYVNMQTLPELQKWCKLRYPEIYTGQNDILYYFVLRGLNVLNNGGKLGFIVSRYFLESSYASKFRKFILENSAIDTIIDFNNFQVFGREVNVLTSIIVFVRDDITARQKGIAKVIKVKDWSKTDSELISHILQNKEKTRYSDEHVDIFGISQDEFTEERWTLSNPRITKIKRKIRKDSQLLGDICRIGQGMTTGLNEAFVLDTKTALDEKIEQEVLRNYIKTRDLKRYTPLKRNLKIIYIPEKTDENGIKNALKHLEKWQTRLKQRFDYKKKHCEWYSWGNLRNREFFEMAAEKIITPLYSTSNKFVYDPGKVDQNYCTLTDTYIIVPKERCKPNLKYILAVLNSKLLEFYFKNTAKLKREGYFEYSGGSLSKIPIKYDENFAGQIILLVDKILSLKKRVNDLGDQKTDERSRLEEEVKKTETQIDELVHKIYEITEAEREIIEG